MIRRAAMRAFALSCALLPVVAAFGADGVKLPAHQSATLANGAQVALVEKRDTPLVSMSVTVRGGALGDQAGKEGTASLFTDLIQKGAGTRDAAQFAKAIENVGGAVAAGAGTESLTVNASFLARDVDLMLELVADALPASAPRRDRVRQDTHACRAVDRGGSKDSDPRALVGSYGDAWLFRGHPYGRLRRRQRILARRGSLDDVKRYYADQVGGDRIVVVVVGDFDSATMLKKLEQAFGSWRKAAAATPAVAAPAPVKSRSVLLVDKPGATQTYFWLGNVGASRTDPARTQQSVVNTVFGGRFTSMLNTELRINSGLTYGASATFDRGSQPGAFSIASYTETSTTTQAIDLALDTLARLHKGGLDAGQLQSSQSYMLGQFHQPIETNGQIAARLTDMILFGSGPEDMQRIRQSSGKCRRGRRAQHDRSVLPEAKNLVLVLIGDAAKIREQVKKYGPVTEMKISDPRRPGGK